MQIKLLWAPFPVFLKAFVGFLVWFVCFLFFSPSAIWLAFPLFSLGSVASCAVAVHLHEGSTLALLSWWQQQDPPWASCFPGWPSPALSASPHMSGAPASLTILVASPGLTPVCPCLCAGELQHQHTSPDVDFQVSDGRNHFDHFCFSSPGCCWPSLPQGLIADSHSTWCPPALQDPFLQSCFLSRETNSCCCTRPYIKGEIAAHFKEKVLRLSLTTSNVLCINVLLFNYKQCYQHVSRCKLYKVTTASKKEANFSKYWSVRLKFFTWLSPLLSCACLFVCFSSLVSVLSLTLSKECLEVIVLPWEDLVPLCLKWKFEMGKDLCGGVAFEPAVFLM